MKKKKKHKKGNANACCVPMAFQFANLNQN